MESIFLISAGLFGFGAIAVFLLVKEKLLSGIFAAIAAVFLTLNFYSDQQAVKEVNRVDLRALEAAFAADWAEATAKPKTEQERLKDRAQALEKEAAAIAEKASKTLQENAAARQPLEALSSQKVDSMANDAPAPKSNF